MNTVVDLTSEQMGVQDAIMEFVRNSSQPFITVGGYAGTGKTTVIAETRKLIGDGTRVAFCAFTGKAGSVLGSKLGAAGIDVNGGDDYCGTIHGLIYNRVEAEEHGKRRVLRFTRKPRLEYDLIIVDEASMLNEGLFQDLLSYGIPIIAVGDHGQLPPVKGTFNLMEKPDYRLETIHRQVADHPIIRVATMARRFGNVPFGDHGEGVRKIEGSKCLQGMDLQSSLVLCGKNRTRVTMNQAIRGSVGSKSRLPAIGDKVICLRNRKEDGIYNGMVGVLQSLVGDEAAVQFEDFLWEGDIHLPQFGQEKTTSEYGKKMGALFDWGYCLTVWKAQGSEADHVVFIEEQVGPPDKAMYARFLYTAITRAKKSLLIIG